MVSSGCSETHWVCVWPHRIVGEDRDVSVITLILDPSHKSHNASEKYPTMHLFVTEMCTRVHISVTKWCIVGYGTGALWDLRDGSIVDANKKEISMRRITSTLWWESTVNNPRWPVDSLKGTHKGPIMRKAFPRHDVIIMIKRWWPVSVARPD